MKKKTLLLSVVLVVSACFFQQAVAGTTDDDTTRYYVSTTGLDSNNGTSESTAFATISKALSSVNVATPVIIYLEAGQEFITTAQCITPITGVNLRIEGNGATIRNTAVSARMLKLESSTSSSYAYGNVILKNITFKDGTVPSGAGGGAVYFGGDTLKVENCIFLNNKGSGAGGAIASKGKVLIVRNCYFKGNQVVEYPTDPKTHQGGAIVHTGRMSDGNYLLVENSTFEENTAIQHGSAIAIAYQGTGTQFYDGKLDNVYIRNCTFLNNTRSKHTVSTGGSAVIHLAGTLRANTYPNTYLTNNTFLFYKEDYNSDYSEETALRIGHVNYEVHLVNNVVAGFPYGIIAVADRVQPITAYNNTISVFEQGATVTDADLQAGNPNNNIVTTYQAYSAGTIATLAAHITDDLKLGTSLAAGAGITVPYLPITDLSSPLVNSGLNSYLIGTTEQVPATDVLGVVRASGAANTGSAVDRGAFEFVDLSTSVSDRKVEDLAVVLQQTGFLTIRNISDNDLSLRIIQVDGRQVYAAPVKGELKISKSELPKGVLIFVFNDGLSSAATKILL